MWKEEEHPRESDGKFTDKTSETKKKEDLIKKYSSEPKRDLEKEMEITIEELYGKEYKGYKGQKAVNKLLKEKQGHVKGAFYREDIGEIDLFWGNEYCGLKHIILRRNEQGIDVEEFLSNLSECVEKGRFRKKNVRGNFEFKLENKICIIAPELLGNKVTYLLTAFKTHSKK